jgi:DNA-binding CsgD family transcriptional regulator
MLATLGPTDELVRPHAIATILERVQDDRVHAPARIDGASMLALLAATVDEIDYGLLLVSSGQHVAHANHAARTELDAQHPLELRDAKLNAKRPQDAALLRDALIDVCQRGHRRLITLGPTARRISISLVPLACAASVGSTWALALIGKPQVCQDLSVEAFARAHKLTQAETSVLKGLCLGARPAQIARENNVAISTVRSHVGSIRSKTSVPSIGALVRTVSMLPPIVSALRKLPN